MVPMDQPKAALEVLTHWIGAFAWGMAVAFNSCWIRIPSIYSLVQLDVCTGIGTSRVSSVGAVVPFEMGLASFFNL
jgi:hypothetical protein